MLEIKRGEFSLEDKYRRGEGEILLSGLQALVRLPLEQHRADKLAGLNTATLISGYRGSPLGTLDMLLQQNEPLLKENQVVFIPGTNEDLAATSIMGSQIVNLFPQPKYDGVVGMWYGKAPGLDRSTDAIRHANYIGTGRHGGVLAIVGDDPAAKSSTLPSHSEASFYDALLPILYPGNVQEILDYGRLGFELSRYSGLWVGFKIVTDVADSLGTAQVAPDRLKIITPDFTFQEKRWQSTQNILVLPPYTVATEQDISLGRLEAARRFAAVNELNKITVPTEKAWLGIVAAGKTYYDVRQALSALGLDEDGLERYGIRLLKVGMLFPLGPNIIKTFADGLEEILVVEEKRAFMELFIRDILYNLPTRPLISGKNDSQGTPLIPAYGELDADKILAILVKRLSQRIELENLAATVQERRAAKKVNLTPLPLARQSYFCSGCPHNTSTVVPEGSLAGAGIGCHTMVIGMNRDTMGVTQMGGEGAQWVGMSPFTDMEHMFQNIGDGTLFHSGSLAIRHSVATHTNITYKILFNSAVAMTGGQPVDGDLNVPDLTKALRAEGVGRIIITTDDVHKYGPDVKWDKNVAIWHRDRLDEAQRVLRQEKGVTVLIHDQMCAAELRRLRKRDKIAEPPERIFINEAVCEGCGDCGVKSNCLSVQPIETEFGRKTQIHQSSCNKDYSCVKGDCPSFITVTPRKKAKTKPQLQDFSKNLPQPVSKVGMDCNIFMMGIGGTGVVTVNQILAAAAQLDGLATNSLDQTGLSQKGGPVASHLKLSRDPQIGAARVSEGETDCYLGFDILTAAAPQNLARTRADRTVAVISVSQVPTGAMVASTTKTFPAQTSLVSTINSTTRADANVYLDALALAEQFFGDHLPANMITVGAAFQAGLLPLSIASIEQAIKLNGASVAANTAAFHLGRKVVAEPEWAAALQPNATLVKPVLTDAARTVVDEVGATGQLLRLLEIRVPELIAYQNVVYARRYARFVKEVREAEQAKTPGQTQLSEAVARYLFKLMAYKDEYEVARLHLKPELRQTMAAQFGPDAKIEYQLHPPFLRAMGLKKKIKLGAWFDPAFKLLVAGRRLRNTPFDPFGYARVRRVERELIKEYCNLIKKQLANLSADNYQKAVKLANLPDLIRGYEDIKLNNVAQYRQQVELLNK